MLFCNNLYLFCWKMSKKWFQVTAEVVKFKCLGIFLKRRGVSVKTSRRFKKTLGHFIIILLTLLYMHQSVYLNAFRVVNTSFYSLNNKNETLKDWKNVKKTCFSIYFFIFSLKKIGYILKIHNFAPSRIRLVYEYF